MTTALFIGRFQPFHNGHLNVIKEILKENDRVFIMVGSAKTGGDKGNPFLLSERIVMIDRALKEQGIENFSIGCVEDFHDDELWVKDIEKQFKFDVVYTRNEWTKGCFENRGYKIKKHSEFEGFSGRTIRRELHKGADGKWKDMVPEPVYNYIHQIRILDFKLITLEEKP